MDNQILNPFINQFLSNQNLVQRVQAPAQVQLPTPPIQQFKKVDRLAGQQEDIDQINSKRPDILKMLMSQRIKSTPSLGIYKAGDHYIMYNGNLLQDAHKDRDPSHWRYVGVIPQKD